MLEKGSKKEVFALFLGAATGWWCIGAIQQLVTSNPRYFGFSKPYLWCHTEVQHMSFGTTAYQVAPNSNELTMTLLWCTGE